MDATIGLTRTYLQRAPMVGGQGPCSKREELKLKRAVPHRSRDTP